MITAYTSNRNIRILLFTKRKYFIKPILVFVLVLNIKQTIGQEQRIGDTTATGIVSYSLRSISGKGTGSRPAYFDSVGRLVPGSVITSGWALDGNIGTSYTNSFIGTKDDQPLVFKSNSNEGLRIVPSGQVGIGVPASVTSFSDANYKLFVYGSIRAKKIRVDIDTNSWADYVFAKGYKLPSLRELEAFIKTHQHLPDVPSAKEVGKNGLDLGESQTILLKKIEELTLYVIEQNKSIENLTGSLETERKLNRELEERVKQLELRQK